MTRSASQLAVEVARCRSELVRLQERAEVVSKTAEAVRHDLASIRGAVLAILDSLDVVDAELAELRQASRGGG